MAPSPKYKVFDSSGNYRASCKHLEDAAVLVSVLGNGSTIRLGHSKRGILWTEGEEIQSASESYDHVATVCSNRELTRTISKPR